MTDNVKILWSLISQVCATVDCGRKSTGDPGINERDVVTFITRPMWRAFLRGAGTNENSNPTPWMGGNSIRVMGSETIVIESAEFWSFSTLRDSDLFRSYQNPA